MLHAIRNCGLIFSALVVSAGTVQAEPNWPTWRGPHGDGHTTETGLPVTWTTEDVAWKTPLTGEGHSSPVVWDERIFLTSALERGRQRVVIGLDRDSGRVLWEQVAWTGQPEPTHKMTGWAAATPATDGERVYAFFGRGGGLHCYTVEGKHVWSIDLGTFEGPWGTAASPLLVGDLVIQNCDAEKDARIVALDKRTGKLVWQTRREDQRGWSSPVLIEAGDRREVVVNGHSGPRAYDPETGEELWYCKSFAGRGTPTVTPAHGLLFLVNGLRGDTYAVRPGGSGTVTDTHMAWHSPRNTGRDLPSPIVLGEVVLVTDMRGILTGYDTSTGRELWRERVGRGENFSATPIAHSGLAFFVSESGETIVIDPAKQSRVVARNMLNPADNEIFRASLTPNRGQLLLRSDRALYCIGTPNRGLAPAGPRQ